jgi:hypothetical protein
MTQFHAGQDVEVWYGTDGKCHNAEPGTFGHECGKPADFIGTKASGFQSGFCAYCAEHGSERHGYTMRPRFPLDAIAPKSAAD